MRVRGCAAAVAAVAVLAALAGCRANGSGTDGSGTGNRTGAEGRASSPVTCAPKSAVNDDPSAGDDDADALRSEELPDEVRCLPSVAYGSLLVVRPGSTATSRKSLTVSVVQGAVREQTLALCHRLTDLGYGPGGRHGVDVLTVDGDPAAGTYLSGPGAAGKACVQAG